MIGDADVIMESFQIIAASFTVYFKLYIAIVRLFAFFGCVH
jgi:hypothetical protein